jgi:hypothetical protein
MRARAPLLTPSPAASRGPCVSRVGAPLPKQRRAARASRGRDAVGTPPAGRSQAPHVPVPRGIPAVGLPSLLSPAAPLKGSHRPPADPPTRSSRSSTLERRTFVPHHPNVRLTGFPPSEPLLRAGLRSSVTAVPSRLRRPVVAPPPRCVPAGHALPGATPRPHGCSRGTPCRRLATTNECATAHVDCAR